MMILHLKDTQRKRVANPMIQDSAAKMETNASTATGISGTKSSQRIKIDVMSVGYKERKLERIEDQPINQNIVKRQEAVIIFKR